MTMYTVSEWAKLHNISVARVYVWIAQERIPTIPKVTRKGVFKAIASDVFPPEPGPVGRPKKNAADNFQN